VHNYPFDQGKIMSSKHPKRKPRPGVDRYGRTPLHNALVPLFEKVNIQEIARLLKEGADPNAQDDDGFSPLHFAAQESLPEPARLLLNAGANPNLEDSFGITPLGRAAHTERGIQVVKLLLAAGADPFKPNKRGFCAADGVLNVTAENPNVANCIRQTAELYRELKPRRKTA
jgi:ankyrin repeat protein